MTLGGNHDAPFFGLSNIIVPNSVKTYIYIYMHKYIHIYTTIEPALWLTKRERFPCNMPASTTALPVLPCNCSWCASTSCPWHLPRLSSVDSLFKRIIKTFMPNLPLLNILQPTSTNFLTLRIRSIDVKFDIPDSQIINDLLQTRRLWAFMVSHRPDLTKQWKSGTPVTVLSSKTVTW